MLEGPWLHRTAFPTPVGLWWESRVLIIVTRSRLLAHVWSSPQWPSLDLGFLSWHLALEGIMSKLTMQGSKNFTVKGHWYGWVVVWPSSPLGLVKSRVMHPILLFSAPWGFYGWWCPFQGWSIPFAHATIMGGVDWVLGDIGSVSSWWRAPELGALWCTPSTQIGWHT